MPVALYRPRRPRRPRASPLWQCLSNHREAFEEQYPFRFQKQDGSIRPVVAQTLDAFTACGDLTRGFARLHCDHCGHDYLIAFSCKQRYFCPCSHQKKVQQFGEFIRHEVVRKVPHRQIVVTLPKRLRKAFQHDRQLLSDFCHAAWLSLRDVIRTRLGTPNGQPGVIIAIQTFGDYLNFHPHLHILITDGAFVGNHSFHTLPRTDWQRVAELLQARVLKFFVRKKKLTVQEARKMLQWHHSGFNVHAGYRIQRHDHDGLEKLAQYILRNPFSLEKMTYVPETGEVIYRSKRNHATQRLWETFDAPAFIAAITRHIPAPGQHLVRYYGAYSNRTRGELRKRCGTPTAPEAADPLPPNSLPTGRCYADFAKNREAMADQSRAAAFNQGMPADPHPDSYAPAPVSQSANSIEIIELPRNAIPRIPRKKWRELIQKVWDVDPFICPNCARPMHINGLLEDRNAVTALLHALGWFTYATDSQCARAPPPHGTDSDAPELPFCRDLDGFVYEPEPWELARQLRLQRHAQQRDNLAGIVIYDGDACATSDVSVDADPGPPTATECRRPALEHPCPVFPDEFDQRAPEELNLGASTTGAHKECPPQWDEHERTWDEHEQAEDPCAQQWLDTPLAKWAKDAAQASVCDNIDVIPQEDEPVFFTD